MKNFFDNSHSVTISPSSIVFAVAFILGLYLLFLVREIVLIVFLAVIFMSALHPAIRWMKHKFKIPTLAGILILYIGIILLLSLAFTMIVPPLASEGAGLVNSLDLQSLNLPALPDHLRRFDFTLPELNNIMDEFRGSFWTVYSILESTFHGIFTFFTILVMTLYLLLEREDLHKKTLWFSRDERHLKLVEEFINSLEKQLGGWVRGQIFLMITMGVLVFVGLTLLGVPYALPLALSAGLFEILPSLGPLLAALPGIIIAFSKMTPAMGGFVVLFYIFAQQLEGHLIVPKIMKDNADVSPLVTIVVILIGFKLYGIFGALLAVPVYILFRTLYTFWSKENAKEG